MQSDNRRAERPSSGFLRAFSVFAGPLALGAALAAPGLAQDDGPPSFDPREMFLESCKAALTGDGAPKDHAALFTGKGSLFGRPADVKLLVQPGPRYLLELDGELDVAWACAPDRSWEIDETGLQWPLELADGELTWWILLVMSGDWLFDPEFAPAISVELVDDDDSDELQHARLQLEGGVLDVRLSVYRASKLPAKLVIGDGEDETTIEFSRWSEGPGHLWPMRTALGGIVLELERFEPPPHYLVDPFARRPSLDDVSFDPNAPAEVESKRAKNGAWLVHPRIDGRDVGWFVFQPGAPSALELRAIAALSPAVVGAKPADPSGTRTRDLVRAKSLTLGPLTWRGPVLGAFDASGFAEAYGTEIAGVLGCRLMGRAVVELDLARERLRLFPSAGFTLADAAWAPLHFVGYAPCALAKLPGAEALLELTVDGHGGVTLHAPFVRSAKLAEGQELAWIELGGTKLVKVPADLAFAERPGRALRTVSGELDCAAFGGDARVVFDVPARRFAVLRRPK